jgi:plasmid stabilization system protein ParE
MPERFRVDVSLKAKRDLAQIYDFIAADKVFAARKWYRGFVRHARSLDELPFRYEEIPEAEEFRLPLLHIIYGHYRIFYLIHDDCVNIIRVIHAARAIRPEMFEI